MEGVDGEAARGHAGGLAGGLLPVPGLPAAGALPGNRPKPRKDRERERDRDAKRAKEKLKN